MPSASSATPTEPGLTPFQMINRVLGLVRPANGPSSLDGRE